MPIEEVLVQHGIVVSEGLRQAGQPSRGNFLQRRLVRLVSDATYVENHPVLGVHVHKIHCFVQKQKISNSAGVFSASSCAFLLGAMVVGSL